MDTPALPPTHDCLTCSSNETMYKAAQIELAVLKRLAQADPDNRKHCIRLLRHFEYRNHFCLVFEPMVRDGCGWLRMRLVSCCAGVLWCPGWAVHALALQFKGWGTARGWLGVPGSAASTAAAAAWSSKPPNNGPLLHPTAPCRP